MTKSLSSRNLLFIVTAVATVLYLVWRTFFTLPFGWGVPSMTLAVILLVCEIVGGLESVDQFLAMVDIREPEPPVIPESWYPEVDILVTTHNEPVEVLCKTVNACIHMDYPDKTKVHIWLCDDTNRPEMRNLADEFGIGYFGMSENKTAKAGNLNNALAQTSAPLVANFDADMIPRSNFLLETVPYFFLPRMKKDEDGIWHERTPEEMEKEEKIGFIQTTQSFYNPDLFQYNLYSEQRVPNEQDYFSRELNIGRNRNNSPLYTGSNTVIAREALEAIGGVSVGSLTEDFQTGLLIQSKGYRTYAISKVLSMGLAPHSIPSLLAQRERWSRGCVQAIRNTHLLIMRGMSFSAKLSYFSALVYWWSYIRIAVYVMVPILSALFHFHVVDCTLRQVCFFWLPYYILSNEAMKRLSGGVRNRHWNNVIYTALFPYMIAPVLLETLYFKKKQFVVTKKSEGGERSWVLALPHIFLLVASIVAFLSCVSDIVQLSAMYNLIIMFWLLVNIKNLTLSILFMFGRDNFRQAPRFYVSLPVEIEYGANTYHGLTTDISETGMCVRFDFPHFIPDDETVLVRIRDRNYVAEVNCRVTHIDPALNRNGWRYSLAVRETSDLGRETRNDPNVRLYRQIVFDRHHTLPSAISDTLTIFDDFSINIGSRLEPDVRNALRKLPRIRLGQPATLDGRDVVVDDFNYRYAMLIGNELPESGELLFDGWPEASMRLKLISAMDGDRGGSLYSVLNWKELVGEPRFLAVLSEWMRMAEDRRKQAAESMRKIPRPVISNEGN